MGITKSEALKAVDRERGPVCEASDKIWDQPETAFQDRSIGVNSTYNFNHNPL